MGKTWAMSAIDSMIEIVSKPISPTDAKTLFLANDLKPLEPFQNTMTAWKSECLRCHNVVSPKYNKVRIRGHQCSYCAGLKLTSEAVLETVRRIGHTPLEPYENALTPWKMRCGGCGKTISPKYNSLQQGRWACGYCGHKRAGQRRKELSSPKAILQMRAAGCEPLTEFPGSNVPWKVMCMNCGAVVSPRLSGILSGQGACNKCGKISGAKKRMFTEGHARKLAQAKKLLPLEKYPGTSRKWKCKCLRCGQIVAPRLNYLQKSIYGCSYCAGKTVDLKTAEAKMKSAKLRPLVPYPGNSGKGWLSECLVCHRKVSPSYGGIKAGQGGCIWCAGKRVDSSFAISVMKSKGLQPLEPFVSAKAKWKSRCLRCLRIVSPSYKGVSSNAGGCSYCAPNFVDIEKVEKIVNQAGLVPLEPYRNASSKWKVRHTKCGRQIEITYDSIRAGHNCKYCAGIFVDASEAVSVMLQAGIQPLVAYPGAKKGWNSKCLTCNRNISPHFSSVFQRGSGCIYCSGGKVDEKDAVKFMKASGLKPLDKFPGANKPWRCECQSCRRVVTPRYASLKSGQGGCRWCADWGIDYEKPGFLYLMENKSLSALKIGIGGLERTRRRSRIVQHEKHGWALIHKMDFAVTDDAFQIEQKIISWLETKAILRGYLSIEQLPQGGYTETFDASEIDQATIWAKVNELSKVVK